MDINKKVFLFDFIKVFKNKLIKHIVQFITEKIESHLQKKLPESKYNKLIKSYDDLFVLWIFDANKNNELDNYIPRGDIVNHANIEYTFVQEGVPRDCARQYINSWRSYKYGEYLQELKHNIDTFVIPGYNINAKHEEGGYTRLIRRIADSTTALNDIIPRTTSISISSIQYKRLKELYKGPQHLFMTNAFCVASKYRFLGGINNNLSVPDIFTKNTIGTNEYAELFGSPLNTRSKYYCSPFDDERATFQSIGSFFNLELSNGWYIANPPFNADFMESVSRRIIEQLTKYSSRMVNVIVILPVWDPETQDEYGLPNYNTPFPAFTLLKDCKYLKARRVLLRDYKYYDYYTDSYIDVTATHMLLLSTYMDDNTITNNAIATNILTKLAERWKSIAITTRRRL